MNRDPDAAIPRRRPRDGERCSCGRRAALVYQLSDGSEIPWCGKDLRDIGVELAARERKARTARAWGPGGARRRLANLAAVTLVAVILAGAQHPADAATYATRGTARSHDGCQRIEQAFLNVGASAAVAERFAYRIAPRESGCVPQYVRDHDDWSYSTVGLNGRTAALRRAWMRLCGHDVRTWAGYETDARCALAAYRVLSWRPWAG